MAATVSALGNPSGSAILDVIDLKTHFHTEDGVVKAVDGVSFRIEKGESIVIIGRSGEGKSVLLKHIVRLLEPDAGRIWVEGQEVSGLEHGDLDQAQPLLEVGEGLVLHDDGRAAQRRGLLLPAHGRCLPAREEVGRTRLVGGGVMAMCFDHGGVLVPQQKLDGPVLS